MTDDRYGSGSCRDHERSAEWNATAYHRLSEPQVAWGEKVLGRLSLRGDETVLDAGCGTGRLTGKLLERLPQGRVIAVDQSANMLRLASERLMPRYGDRIDFIQADLAALDLDQVADVIFSTATFHWVRDHPRLFRNLYRALKRGGLLVAQCGGGPNLTRLLGRAAAIMSSPPYADFFSNWTAPLEFADPGTSARRLQAAGFVEVHTSLEPSPVAIPNAKEFREFLRTIVFRIHLERIPQESLRRQFLDALTALAAQDHPPFLLDYHRLNLEGKRDVQSPRVAPPPGPDS